MRIPFLGRLFSNGNGHRRSEALAHATDVNSSLPSPGSVMSQFFGQSEVRGEVKKLLGVFNPRAIGVDTRLLMRNDPDVAFGLAILRAPIVNLGYSVEGEDPKINAAVEWQLRQIYRPMAIAASMALHFGWQLLEKVWEVKPVTVVSQNQVDGTDETFNLPMAWTIHKTKAIDPRTVTLLLDQEKDEWGGAEQRTNRFGITGGGRVGTEQLILWSFRKEEVWGHLQGYPISDQCYEPWWWKAAMNLFANRYFERKADPGFKALADTTVQDSAGNKIDGFTFMAQQILGLRNGGALVLPNRRDPQGNLQFDATLLQDDKRGDMFQQRIDALSQQILRALWITDKAGTSDGSGSLAMAEVHADTLSLTLQSIINEWIDDVVNPQVVDPFVLYNFGPEALESSRTRVTSSGLSKSFRDMLSTLLTQLLQAEQLTAGGGKVTLLDRLDSVAIAERLGLPLRSAEEMEELSEAKAQRAEEFGNGPRPPGGEEEDEEFGEVDDEEVAEELTDSGVSEDE